MTDPFPLSQVSPNSLEHLFNLDPDSFTGPDDPRLMEMVRALRAERARWEIGERKAKAEKKAAPVGLSLGDLDL